MSNDRMSSNDADDDIVLIATKSRSERVFLKQNEMNGYDPSHVHLSETKAQGNTKKEKRSMKKTQK